MPKKGRLLTLGLPLSEISLAEIEMLSPNSCNMGFIGCAVQNTYAVPKVTNRFSRGGEYASANAKPARIDDARAKRSAEGCSVHIKGAFLDVSLGASCSVLPIWTLYMSYCFRLVLKAD